MDEMKTTIADLTTSMEESKHKMELLSNEERRKEKELFLKIIKNYEDQRSDLLNTFTSETSADYLNCKQENITLKAQIDKLEDDNEAIIKKYNLLKSQIDTSEKVMKEQIQKKKEMLEENRNLKSQLSMLEGRVSQAKNEMTKVISSNSENVILSENKELKIHVNSLKLLENELKEDRENLRKENEILKQSINALVTSKGLNPDEEYIAKNAPEVKDKEIEELNKLQEMISNWIDKILAKSNIVEEPHSDKVKESNKIKASDVTLEDLESTFKELREYQSKLYTVTQSLNDCKIKIHELETKYAQEKHKFMETEYNTNHQNKLLKLQIEEFIKVQREGKCFDPNESAPAGKEKLFNKMKIILQKAQKLTQLNELGKSVNKND